MQERIIGRHTSTQRGPLLIAIGGMHGNEPAGIQALSTIFRMLKSEPNKNPDFYFRGQFLGVRGNVQAIRAKKRFLHKDLNRQLTEENVARVKNTPLLELEGEDLEVRQLIELVEQEIATYQPDVLYILDLHTTTAGGGIFTIVTDDKESVRMEVALHAPAIRGMMKGIKGTTLHYFTTENMQVRTIPVTFESGQHDDPLSVNRAVSAIVNCLRTIGCVPPRDVEHRHDDILQTYSKYLPKISDLLYVHTIAPDDEFEMCPGFKNFQVITKGQLLAHDQSGPIRAKHDGHILMPLYQKQGEDGFFVIRAVEA
ncbi:MAG: succinylglutamate desuccinylase/aspartoacylase family protein [Bacteroidota bacterium]